MTNAIIRCANSTNRKTLNNLACVFVCVCIHTMYSHRLWLVAWSLWDPVSRFSNVILSSRYELGYCVELGPIYRLAFLHYIATHLAKSKESSLVAFHTAEMKISLFSNRYYFWRIFLNFFFCLTECTPSLALHFKGLFLVQTSTCN